MGNTQSSNFNKDAVARKSSNASDLQSKSRQSDSFPLASREKSRKAFHEERHKLKMVDEDIEYSSFQLVKHDKAAEKSESAEGLPEESVAADDEKKEVATFLHWKKGGQNAAVVGSFNGWKQKIRMVKSANDFSALVNLKRGTHRLRFLVDGEYKCSDELPTATDSMGNLVNYIEVASEELTLPQDHMQLALNPKPDPTSGKYSSEIPEWIRSDILPLYGLSEGKPPSMPAQLETVILNRNLSSTEDQSVLLTPNHSVLNHLAATSVKNRVLAVSSTSRYRHKYLTTVFYTPVD